MSEKRLSYIEVVVLLSILILLLLFLICGCTDRIYYRHDWIDPNGISHIVRVSYSEGVGNSKKQSIEVILTDGASLSLGQSTTDQDKYMEMLSSQFNLLKEMIDAWMNANTLSGGIRL